SSVRHPSEGRAACPPDGSDRGRAVTTSVILHRMGERRNTAMPPPNRPPAGPREGRKTPVLRAFPRFGPHDRLAKTERPDAMMAHRLCIALSFFCIWLWDALPLHAAQAASTPGASAPIP